MSLIQVRDLTKIYRMGTVEVPALRGVSLDIAAGEMVAIMGPSGSGKSTLMNILGCLDVSRLSDDQLAQVRGQQIGFVFQNFNLLPRLTAVEQVELPLLYAARPVPGKTRRQRAIEALEQVGLADRLHHRPTELSGGQQQRVAIARALVNRPSLILADEPTGNLDSRTSVEIMALFQQLNRAQGITVIFVTHEPDIARYTRRIIHIRDGCISSDEPVPQPTTADPAVLAGASGDGKATEGHP